MKSLNSNDITVRSFIANKTWTLPYVMQSTTGSIFVDRATAPPNGWSFETTDPQNTSGIYEYLLYGSVQHVYYDPVLPATATLDFYPTGSQYYTINFPYIMIGQGIKPGSFALTAALSTASIYDDSNGHLISSTDTTHIIGNIFYTSGLVVLQQDTGSYSASVVTDQGGYFPDNTHLTIEYQSTVTIYEHEVLCTMESSEFNYSTNPTMQSNVQSGSAGATGSSAQTLFFSGSLTPYFTTIGLYNDARELLVVAKVPRAVTRVPAVQQSVILRYDT